MGKKKVRRSRTPTLRSRLTEGQKKVEAFRAETLLQIILSEVARQEEVAAREEDTDTSEDDADMEEEDADAGEDTVMPVDEDDADVDEDNADVGEEYPEVDEEDADADEEDPNADEEYPDSARRPQVAPDNLPMPDIPSAHRALAMPVVRAVQVYLLQQERYRYRIDQDRVH